MPVSLEKALGHKSELPLAWNQRDMILYAAGVGAKADELQHLYELSPDWHPLPSFCLVLPFRGDNLSVVNYSNMQQDSPNVHMPPIVATAVVHASQSFQILKDLPLHAGPQQGFKAIKKLTSLKDTGKGLIIGGTTSIVDSTGTEYVRMTSGAYAFGNFSKFDGFVKGFNKDTAPAAPVTALNKVPTRAPDFTFVEATTKEQATIYRLSGDWNPLHIDPAVGKKICFPGTILHGLCSYGHAARAISLSVSGGDASLLTFMSARFTSPVLPGDTFVTKMWVSDANDGGKRVDFEQSVQGTGKVCLGGGVALLKKKSAGSKL